MLKATHKGAIPQLSKEPDTSWLSECMDFPKTHSFVRSLAERGTVRLHCGCTERLVTAVMKTGRRESQKTANCPQQGNGGKNQHPYSFVSFCRELFTEILASKFNGCKDSWIRDISDWGSMEHVAMVPQGAAGSLCSRGRAMLSEERFQAGCTPGACVALQLQPHIFTYRNLDIYFHQSGQLGNKANSLGTLRMLSRMSQGMSRSLMCPEGFKHWELNEIWLFSSQCTVLVLVLISYVSITSYFAILLNSSTCIQIALGHEVFMLF